MPPIETLDEATLFVASQNDIVRNWAHIAHDLGYGWCAGTKSNGVGGDFSTRQVGPAKFGTYANYDPNDPKPASHPKWDTRLKMTFSNVSRCIDPSTMEFAPVVTQKLGARFVNTFDVVNADDRAQQCTALFSVAHTSSVSHSSHVSFKEGFSVKQKWGIGVPGLGGTESEFQVNFESSQGWSDMQTKTTTEVVQNSVTVNVPARSKIKVDVYAFDTSHKVRYSAIATYDYQVSLQGFLRYDWNAKRKDEQFPNVQYGTYSVIDRPLYNYTFGARGMSAVEHLTDSMQHYYSAEYDPVWDWNACLLASPGIDDRRKVMASNLPKQRFEGEFNNVTGKYARAVIRQAIPLTNAELAEHNRRQQTDERVRSHKPMHQQIKGTAIWREEKNHNHYLLPDGTIRRKDGSKLSEKNAVKMIIDKHLENRLTKKVRSRVMAHARHGLFSHHSAENEWKKAAIWREPNNHNHYLLPDGTLRRKDGSKLSEKSTANMYKKHHLEDELSSQKHRASR